MRPSGGRRGGGRRGARAAAAVAARAGVGLLCVAGLAACDMPTPMRTLHPMVAAGEHRTEEALVGRWIRIVESDSAPPRTDPEVRLLVADRADSYQIILVNGDESQTYRARSRPHGDMLLVELSAPQTETIEDLPWGARTAYIPVHAQYFTASSGDTLVLKYIDASGVTAAIDSGLVRWTHRESIVIDERRALEAHLDRALTTAGKELKLLRAEAAR